MNEDFAHLTTHSHYSLLSGISKIKNLVKTAKESGCTALGLTDTNNMYAAIEFYKECKNAGIKPILGSSIFVKSNNDIFKINLLAKNINGYRNILNIVTNANLNGDKNFIPYTTNEFLTENSDGVIAIVPVINSEWTHHKDDSKEIQIIINNYKDIFKEDLYLGIGNHDDIHNYQSTKDQLIKLAEKNNVKIVAAQIIYFLKKSDIDARQAILKIRGNSTHPELDEYFKDANLSMPTKDEMLKMFNKKYINNIENIINSINLEITMGRFIFPDTGIDGDVDEALKEKVFSSLSKKGLENNKDAMERVEYELKIINEKGYSPYFLAVIDIVDYMHKNGVLTTTRGSAAGSIVAYLTGITNVDPIEYNLPFERFLNPYRPSAPDIDLDIADDKRDFVIEYITKRFGEENVAQIGTFGTMKARAVVRDVARALGYPYITGDRIAKLIPHGKQGFPMTIQRAFEEAEEFKNLYTRDEEVKKIIDLAKKLEGNARHISIHAAGVVISPDKITNHIPLQSDYKESTKMITQFDMNAIEDIGLIKFDILGLTNLSTLDKAVKIVNKRFDKEINLDGLPIDDKKTFDLLSKGRLEGVFQLGASAGIKVLTKKLKPSSISDISAIIALYRPGPIQNIDKYIDRKHNREPITYTQPAMEKYLKDSYGILVYQDDILFTAIELAGYDWEQVDVLRKAIGKKIPELMKSEHKNFVNKCVAFSKISKGEAEELWDLFEPFQGYGFNKAHASAYAKVAYQTAYMKANYPNEYMAALLSTEMNDTDRISSLSRECKMLNIKILPPNINTSHTNFIVGKHDNEIITGLGVIKNLGEAKAKIIVSEREEGGPYQSVSDFIKRISTKMLINRRFLEALIKTGCLDEFEQRHILLENLFYILDYAKDFGKIDNTQPSLFCDEVLKTDELVFAGDVDDISIEQKLFWEKDFTGMYISSHPLRHYKTGNHTISEIKEAEIGDRQIELVSVITELKRIKTKKGNDVTFVMLEDDEDSIEAVIFSDTFNKFEEFLAKNRCIRLQGKTSVREGNFGLILESVSDPKKS